MSISSRKIVGLAAALFVVAVSSGCSSNDAAAGTQELTVTYLADGQKQVESVNLNGLSCSRVGEMLVAKSDELKLSVSNEVGSAMLALQLPNDVAFVSNEKFTEADGVIALNDIEGIVATIDADNKIVSSIDTGAVLSGTIECD